ncbi:hypothetical protein ACSHT0_06585 [Tepidicaulis sp. LMO-SS28]|uniref:hypothetical protein n=1 Tax=Tepidicaulis sp. LMO-SS28 TaxID=3447455 RepID=UPI003EE238F0
MPEQLKPFHTKVKGSLAEDEDWWYLEVDEDSGQQVVRHKWHHCNPYKLSQPANEGSKTYSIDEFLSGDHDGRAKAALRDHLGDQN